MKPSLFQKRPLRRPQSLTRAVVTVTIIFITVLFIITAYFILVKEGAIQGTATLTLITMIGGLVISLLSFLITYLQWHNPHPSENTKSSSQTSLPHPVTISVPIQATTDVLLNHTVLPIMIQKPGEHIFWGEAPQVGRFYGREQEREQLKEWLLDDNCNIVALLGMGGMGKTRLAFKVIDDIKDSFTYIFWYSLRNSPPLQNFLQECIQFLSERQHSGTSDDIDIQISLFFDYIHKYKCLIILDNCESIMEGSKRAGTYRQGYKNYGDLIQRIGESRHQSCLLLTSREKSQEVALLEDENAYVHSCQLKGLEPDAGYKILQDKGLSGQTKDWSIFIEQYNGNPLALRLVSQFIREVFDGNIANFLAQGEYLFSDIRDILEQQFTRLTLLEQEVLYWLALTREGTSLSEIQGYMAHPVSNRDMQETLRSLRRRSLTETNATGNTLQNVVMEYVTERYIANMAETFNGGDLNFLQNHALMLATAKDYIRTAQIRLLVRPLAQHINEQFGIDGVAQQCKKLLKIPAPANSYMAGNILNLLVQQACNLAGYDFSHLQIKQAYLLRTSLIDVNFSYASFVKTYFNNTFGDIYSVIFSPDGTLLATGTSSGDIWIWSVSTGILERIYQGHTDQVHTLDFSPDGRILASGCLDHSIRLWDMQTGICTQILQGHTKGVMSVKFSHESYTLVSGSYDSTVRVWDVSTGICKLVIEEHTKSVRAVALSPDSKILASSSDDHTIRIWDLSNGQCLRIIKGDTHRNSTLAIHPNGHILASGGVDQRIYLWDVQTGESVRIMEGHHEVIWNLTFSRDGRFLASCNVDHTIRLWEVATGRCLRILHEHTDGVASVAFSPDGQTLASGSPDQTIRLWEVASGYCFNSWIGYQDVIRYIALSLDGELLASSHADRVIRLWNVKTGKCIQSMYGHTHRIMDLAFHPQGQILASCSEGTSIHLWDIRTGRTLSILEGHTRGIMSIDFNKAGSLLASGGNDQTIRIWNVKTGSCLRVLTDQNGVIWSVTFNPDGKTLVSTSESGEVILWEVETGAQLHALQGHTNWVFCSAFTADGSKLATGDRSGQVRLWDIKTGECLQILQDHKHEVWSVVFKSDSQQLITGCFDGTARLWDITTGEYLHEYKCHTHSIYTLVLDPDEQWFVSCSDDGTIAFWDLSSGKCLRTLKSDRPYERMDITGITGLTDMQKTTLKALGAIDKEDP